VIELARPQIESGASIRQPHVLEQPITGLAREPDSLAETGVKTVVAIERSGPSIATKALPSHSRLPGTLFCPTLTVNDRSISKFKA
jgi:hypothetical protein